MYTTLRGGGANIFLRAMAYKRIARKGPDTNADFKVFENRPDVRGHSRLWWRRPITAVPPGSPRRGSKYRPSAFAPSPPAQRVGWPCTLAVGQARHLVVVRGPCRMVRTEPSQGLRGKHQGSWPVPARSRTPNVRDGSSANLRSCWSQIHAVCVMVPCASLSTLCRRRGMMTGFLHP